MKDHMSRGEIRKDAVQGAVQATASAVGQVGSIVSGAVRDLAGALGGLATELYEIRDSARRAAVDHARDVPPGFASTRDEQQELPPV